MTSGALRAEDDILAYLHRHEHKEILRFVAVGSVDDGKSTLIGRLLHDTNGIFEDQLSAVKRASRQGGAEIDFSLFTDGLLAEREQGITIDVAYRYFTTEKRKFIIADTPGHVEYTRNMATGASTADVAIILIDARLGVLPQSRRHAYIASLLGIRNLVACVNKMDLVEYDPAIFESIKREFSAFAANLSFQSLTFIPVSALRGENVVTRAPSMPFYDGQTLLEYLETVPIARDTAGEHLRYPVQSVLRPDLHYRGYAAQIASGKVKRGDNVTVLPSKRTSKVVAIDTYDGELDEAFAPMSVTLRLADEVDVSRGDMIVHSGGHAPTVTQELDAMVVWLHERPLDRNKSYLLKHTTRTVRAEVSSVKFTIDLETLNELPAESLGLNDIGRISVRSHRPLFVDPYTQNRATGAFILIDSLTNDTVAAGMILSSAVDAAPARGERSGVSPNERKARLGHEACAVVLEAETLEAAERTAYAVERELFDRGALATVVIDASLWHVQDPQAVTARSSVNPIASCVDAGIVVVTAVPRGMERAHAEISQRLGKERVIHLEALADVEATAKAALAAAEAKRVFG